MKKSDLQKMLGLIDDDILNEARPSDKRPKSKTSMWLKIVSAVACFLLVFNVILVPAALFMNGKISSLTNELDGKNQLIDNILNGSGNSNSSPEDPEALPPHVQNVLELPLGKNNDRTVLLNSPLLSAPSKYGDIINSMIEASPNLDDSWLEGGNLEDAMDQIEGELSNKDETSEELAPDMGDLSESEGGDKYEETTDLQVKDVIEGDIIKRSSKYIYYLSGSKLKIYSINKQNSELVGFYSLDKHIEALNEALKIPEQPKGSGEDELENELEEKYEIIDDIYYTPQVKEMFLSADLKTITIVVENRVNTYNLNRDYAWNMVKGINDALYCTTLISLNIEDVSDVYLNDLTTVFGRYESARFLNGEFLLFTKYVPIANELIIPQYNDGEGFEYIPYENIYSPNEYQNGTYLISYRINGDSYDVSDMLAYASFDGEIYVTKNNIYITREYYDVSKIYGEYPIYAKDVTNEDVIDENVVLGYGKKTTTYKERMTDILRVDISDGVFAPQGVLTVDGYIKDRYSLHENGEYLYVVTTDSPATVSTIYEDLQGNITRGMDDLINNGTSANIYVADISVMVLTSKLERFAPSGETVRSVRYEGHNAYVCTAVLNTDPVFFFDLSDPFNITYSDTGTIPGFSTSLIELPSGELLGIGTDGDGYVKLEVYRMGENNTVVIVDTIKIKATSYSTDYKSYFIDRENGYFGLGYRDWQQEDSERYALVKYENGYFTLVFDRALRGDNSTKRAVLIDGYFYLLSSDDFEVIKIK